MTDVLEPYQKLDLKPGDRFTVVARLEKSTKKDEEPKIIREIVQTTGKRRVVAIPAFINDAGDRWIYHQYRGLLQRIIHLSGQDEETGIWAFNEFERMTNVLGIKPEGRP